MIRENYIIIGDAVNSVAILEIINDRIVLKARDFSPLWPLSLEASDKTSIIGANVSTLLYLGAFVNSCCFRVTITCSPLSLWVVKISTFWSETGTSS